MKKRLPGEDEIPALPETVELDLLGSDCCPGLRRPQAGPPPAYRGKPIEIKIDFDKLIEEAGEAMKCVPIVPIREEKKKRRRKG